VSGTVCGVDRSRHAWAAARFVSALAASETCGRLCLLNRTVVADGAPEGLRDVEVWLRAFGVTRSEQLLQALGGRR
jgi:hypothetical protein